MKRPTGSPGFYLASSVTEKTLVANSEERLHTILATLEECQAALVASGNRETAQLVSVAILELRIKLNHDCRFGIEGIVRCDVAGCGVGGTVARSEIAQGLGGRAPVSLKLVK